MSKPTTNRFSPEVRSRAVRMVFEHQAEHPSQWAAINSIAGKIGCTGETLRSWVRQAERDQGLRGGSDDGGQRPDQGTGAREPRAAPGQRDPAQGVGVFCPGGARPPFEAMIAFIDEHRGAYGVEPICKVLPIAPSTYHAHAARRADPARAAGAGPARRASWRPTSSACATRTSASTACARSGGSSGARERSVARCTVARLMRRMGLHGVVRGREVRTTVSNPAGACPLDRVNRQFQAPTPEPALGLGLHLRRDLAGLRLRGLRHRRLRPAHRRLAGQPDRCTPASCSTRWSRLCTSVSPAQGGGLVHHSDRGSQYVSIRYTERLAEAGIEPSVGSVGDSYDNALAETINGLYKTEVIRRRGPWRSLEAVEFATLEWVDWFNHRRLLEPIGNIPPAEAEARYYHQIETLAMAA